MEFKINPLAFTGIFAVPNALVDDNIRLAGLVQLKVLLYLLRHGTDNVTSEKIAETLLIPKEEVSDALVFWLDRGILVKDISESAPVHTAVSPVPTATPLPKEKAEEKKVADIPISRPSHEQIAARCKECEDLAELFREAQNILGKTIGYDGQSVLIMLHDSYGLPLEVILMAIEYAVTMKKASFSNIAKIGKRWSELEIDSLEGAMEYIEEHNIVDETWQKLRTLTEITNRNPTEKQRKLLTAWVKEYGYGADIIYYAYEESIDRTGKMSMPYMDKIIRTWHEKGVKTATDIETEQLKWKAMQEKKYSKKEKDLPKESDASYDIDAYLKKGLDLMLKNDEN